MTMATNIPYNDDVELTPIDANTTNTDSSVNDTSTHGTSPSVDPITVTDNSNRIVDNWIKNNTATAGDAGETYTDTPPTEKDPLAPPVYKTIIRKTREIINNYSPSYLQQLHDEGVKFYVVYTDGTENEVEYTEIYDPRQITVGRYVNEAQAIAEATEQHFWHDDNGAHVTDIEQDDWKTAAEASFNDLSDNKPYHNILMNSLGILLRRALNNLLSISKSAITFYDGFGNNLANIRASFGSAGATFRENGKTKATITARGFSVYDNDGSISGNNETLGTRLAFIGVDDNGKPYTRIGKSAKGYIDIGVNENDNGYIDFYNNTILLAHIGCDAGANASGGTSLAPHYNLGLRKPDTTIGNYSLIEGNNTTASGFCSHAEGYATTASASDSHAEGYATTASGYGSHAEGYLTTASGTDSHAEGGSTKASATDSHAEGYATTASGYGSHAEGGSTTASGKYSHAEGESTTASGYGSHASGQETIAEYRYQFVCGKYNSNSIYDLFEIGNGVNELSRANAFRVTTSNTAYIGSTSVTSDERIKTDLGKLNPKQAIDFIKSLIPHKYEKFGRKELGFFAQDVEKDPNYGDILVEQYKDHGYEDFRSLSYDGLIAPIVSVEQNLIERIEQLEKQNSELKLQNESLNKRLLAIEEKLGIETK